MFSSLFTEVKIRGMGQYSGVSPSGPAFMYQAQTTPPAPLMPTPQGAQVVPGQSPMPTSTSPSQAPVLPPSPVASETISKNSVYIAGAIALVALIGACLIPVRK